MKKLGFECLKSIRNYEKKMLGTSDAWSMSRSSQQPSDPAYYISMRTGFPVMKTGFSL